MSKTNHKQLVKWIEDSFSWELMELLEDKLGYQDKHQLASTIIKYSPIVKRQLTKGDKC